LPLLLWIGVIFFLSSGQGASTQTSRIIRPLLEFFFPDASFETIAFYHGIIRKLAHFIEYAVLGFLACRAFVASALGQRSLIVSALLVVAVAVIDETNQSFNPQRTGSPIDVFIDVTGGLSAILIVYLLMKRSRRLAPDSIG
jgi:VanZ family protein